MHDGVQGRGIAVESVVLTDGLTKHYGKTVALDDLNLEVRRGEIFGFLGPNGAGKTTTIRILLTLIKPDSGSATIFGSDIKKHGQRIRRLIGYLPGELALYDNLSARQLFQYTGSLNNVENLNYADELSERLRISNVDQKVGSLSQGNKQKVGLVQALLHRPALLILDEPTNALDPLIRAELYDILREACDAGMTILFSSHVLAEAEAICDRVAIIREGRLTRVGTITELKAISPRRVRLTFEGNAPIDAYQQVPDLSEIEQPEPNIIEITSRATPENLIQVMAAHPPSDVVWEEISLEEIFLGYYQTRGAYNHDV
jgi:ABC-2 type transport system ATP-binding protein